MAGFMATVMVMVMVMGMVMVMVMVGAAREASAKQDTEVQPRQAIDTPLPTDDGDGLAETVGRGELELPAEASAGAEASAKLDGKGKWRQAIGTPLPMDAGDNLAEAASAFVAFPQVHAARTV